MSDKIHLYDPMQIFLTDKYRHLRYGPRYDPQEPLSFWTRFQMSPDVLFESCLFRGVFSGFAGFGLGMLMGGFFHTMQPIDTIHIDEKMSTWNQVKRSYDGFGASCMRSAKGFAKVGLIYSTVECVIERERGTRDIQNAIYGGCVTGAALAYQAGPQAMAFGCAGFAAFSGIIEKVLNSD
jgi:mitochondrial import inner membrane translocase subunit TIM22